LLTGRTGGPVRPDNLSDRFNQLAVAAQARPIGPHQIRHLIASTLLDAGYGVHKVAEWLGHDPGTLMRYYTRVNAARRGQTTDRSAELMTLPEDPARPNRCGTGQTTLARFSEVRRTCGVTHPPRPGQRASGVQAIADAVEMQAPKLARPRWPPTALSRPG
jgi:hypothetical protein